MKLLNINTLARSRRPPRGLCDMYIICNLDQARGLGQSIPVTLKCVSKPNRCRYQNIGLARFDPLQSADVKIRQFGKLLLRH